MSAYDDDTKEELQDELRDRGLKTTGNKPVLIARLEASDRGDEPDESDDDDDTVDTADTDQTPGAFAIDPGRQSSPIISDDGEHRRPEPADVAGFGGEGFVDNAQEIAHRAQRENDARYHIDGIPGRNESVDPDARVGEYGVDEDRPAEGYSESTLPVTGIAEQRLADWREAHPDAEVIPPALLPPAYLDPMIATPGLPGDPITEGVGVEDDSHVVAADGVRDEDDVVDA